MYPKISFSIVLPTYNREHRIERAIKSIIAQSFLHWELIIVDDASSDKTAERIEPFLKDERIIYIRNEKNLERCLSRNRGIEIARGDYVCFLDSDDYHLPKHLETFHDFLKKNNFPKALLFTNSFNESEEGELSDRVCPDLITHDLFTYFLRYTVNPQRWCVHRNVILNHLFDPEVVICEDLDTSLRIAAAGPPIFQIPERTTVYVAASDSFTHGDPKKWEKELYYLKRIFQKQELKKLLPGIEKRRLLSMCYFHIAIGQIDKNNPFTFYRRAMLSFVLYPKGYNGKTNKILFVQLVYRLPLMGNMMRKLINTIKRDKHV